MCKVKHLLDSDSLRNIYFAYVHSYLNYANIAWGSTHVTKLKKLFSQQKQACLYIYHEGKHTNAHQLLQNSYQKINLYQTLSLMQRVKAIILEQSLKKSLSSQAINILQIFHRIVL